MSNVYALRQYGDDPLKHHFIDHEGRAAFTIGEIDRNPNPLIRITREAAWSQQHPNIMGPDNAYLYLGPQSSSGYVVYGGNRTHIAMNFFLRPGKREGSLSRYFRCQNGRDYKWKIGSHRMECLDGRTTLATWEVSSPDQEYYAILTIKNNAGMALVTEILTSLTLNRMALAFGW